MAKKRIDSRTKGAKNERKLAEYLRTKGFEARRGQQFSGGADSPDVVSNFPFHIECKAVERLNLGEAMKQARRDSEGSGKPPCVIHKKNRGSWQINLDLEDFVELLDELMRDNI